MRVAAAGVCHSDLHLADGALGDGRWPLVLGHEGARAVEAVGNEVVGLVPGDQIAFASYRRVALAAPAAPGAGHCASRLGVTAWREC